MATDALRDIVRRNRRGEGVGIYSVCSAHPLVIEASMRQAAEDGTHLLIEATSNQVDQFGGYTGMTPAGFRDFVYKIARRVGFPVERLILGGDHLGPNRWQNEAPAAAMDKAEDLVRAYVAAGYTKIHLDCSMSCAGDPLPLTDEVVAERAARLLGAAAAVAADTDRTVPVSYVIGTEVPVPGGAHEELGDLTPTSPEAARETIAAHKRIFDDRGLADQWGHVLALVVQPAVEFDHLKVVDYVSENTRKLQEVLRQEAGLVFEAHSTDYQTQARLTELVRDGWAILKVGPGLTFNLREGLYALAAIEDELIWDADARSNLRQVIERVMLAEPAYWSTYYEGTEHEQRIARSYSYSDRLRYYLPHPTIVAAIEQLFANLDSTGIPEPLISQYLPRQFERVREGRLEPTGRELAIDHVRDALRPYGAACGL